MGKASVLAKIIVFCLFKRYDHLWGSCFVAASGNVCFQGAYSIHIFKKLKNYNQSWLQDGIFRYPESLIPIPLVVWHEIRMNLIKIGQIFTWVFILWNIITTLLWSITTRNIFCTIFSSTCRCRAIRSATLKAVHRIIIPRLWTTRPRRGKIAPISRSLYIFGERMRLWTKLHRFGN